ncbi:hypothetical protein EVJ58_g6265 [Rhodofomes roseus]|uniref:Uncharacterized protein n=1 Tax=Rhodofomes roseus TaxID=34475 RepID=A0A4Y9Y9I2_9APHY|nr:hypothetical protein EVJ58_g6265 [Rhodofomes roseus]
MFAQIVIGAGRDQLPGWRALSLSSTIANAKSHGTY